ncbi:MAG: TRAP transporter large permease [Geminicoccaceae bacterium]|nr:TRAP transporter large permease [Geminicoccaceae bacterium]MCS7269039.1 TRAP transporter large permease [Geminicoccaceae bacterium]MCX7631013.1 TRAP transporter large permease [Geminicoccaceae bacterium]MDW8125459.1 TRAP transporter large permease [Geminicoccaceae bacterium]MDW8341968.1 TRAP transporter large permease [Geminicoccaceae bacterium]
MLDFALAFGALFALVFARMPLGLAMLLVGTVGFADLVSWPAALSMLAQTCFEAAQSYTLSVLPLFVLMGNLLSRAGVSRELFSASYALLGHLRGGLAMTTIVAAGGFSAVCGSSLATAATMTKVAMPEMRRFGYRPGFAAGAVAAGGTLGILIPPSVILVIYGLLTQSDIGKLFLAGVLPGLLGILLYVAAVVATTAFFPELGPPGERRPWPERIRALRGVLPTTALFLVILGGIYLGVFTPTEAAAIGAAAALAIAFARGALDLPALFEVLVESARTTAVLFTVIMGALVFGNLASFAGFPDRLAALVEAAGLGPWAVVTAIVLVYLLLGCVLESLSMILLTVPVFYPIVQGLDLGLSPEAALVWFGIVVVVVTEISLLTPPVGMNVFVLRGLLPDVPLVAIYKGVTPFWIADIVRLALILYLPVLSLLIPGLA